MGEDGAVVWDENSRDLDDHNSLAKVMRSAEFSGLALTVRDVWSCQANESAYTNKGPRRVRAKDQGKRYVWAVMRACGAGGVPKCEDREKDYLTGTHRPSRKDMFAQKAVSFSKLSFSEKAQFLNDKAAEISHRG